ncbi:MAG TPA: DnaJ domain-containing protein [Fimbriimonas sp.]|nr:DnaJ domain-containing protein [Fimbriimonas sp.]
MNTLTLNFYEILGVRSNADEENLRKAYRKLARIHHPDVSADPRAHELMARINEAFATLSDPSRRVEYDAMLAGGGLQTSVDASKPRGPEKPIVVKLKKRLTAHKTPVYAVAFAPDTGQLVSSAFDNEIIWWDESHGAPARRTKIDIGTISTLRPGSGDRLFAAGSGESQISLYRLEGPKVDGWRTSAEEWVSSVAISPDGTTVASGSLLHTFTVSNMSDGNSVYRKNEHTEAVTVVTWSEDGKMVATGSADATVKLWHAQTGALLHTIRQVRGTVTALAFSHDNRYLAVAGVDLSIRVFSLSDGLLVKMMFGHTKPIESLAFHPNGWLFASGSRDGTVGLWNAAKGIGNLRIEASSRPITCVAFNGEGTRLAACGQDKVVRLWEVAAKESA